jgi:Short C-terminal domain
MGYLLKAGVGLTLFFGAIVLFNVKLQELLDTGTCASGNVPYEIAPGYQCPPGTGTDILLVSASVFIGLIGAAIFAFRGDPPWGERKRSVGFFGLGTLAWGIFFAGTGAALILGQPYGESVNEAGEVVGRPDSQLGSTIVGITFLVMGLPALLLGLWSGIKGLGSRDTRPSAATASAGAGSAGGVIGRMRAGLEQAQAAQGIGARMQWGSAGGGRKSPGDAIGKIERLQKLKESGAINDSEFAREKAKILAEQ